MASDTVAGRGCSRQAAQRGVPGIVVLQVRLGSPVWCLP